MKKLLATGSFETIDDPYQCNRICLKAKFNIIKLEDVRACIEDDKFLFIGDNIIFFDK